MALRVSLYDGGDTILPIDVVDMAIQLCESQDWPTLREVLNATEEVLAMDNRGKPWLHYSAAAVLNEVYRTVTKISSTDWYAALRMARDEMPTAVEV